MAELAKERKEKEMKEEAEARKSTERSRERFGDKITLRSVWHEVVKFAIRATQFVRPLGIFLPREREVGASGRGKDWSLTFVCIGCAFMALIMVRLKIFPHMRIYIPGVLTSSIAIICWFRGHIK